MGVLVKKLLNLISFPLIPPNFMGNENLRFSGNREEWVFPSTHSIPSHLNSQQGNELSIHSDKTAKQEGGKNILKIFFSFHSISYSQAEPYTHDAIVGIGKRITITETVLVPNYQKYNLIPSSFAS